MGNIYRRLMEWLNAPVETYEQIYWLSLVSIAIVMAALFVLIRI